MTERPSSAPSQTSSFKERLANWRGWHFVSESQVLALFLLIVSGVWIFVQIADEVQDNETFGFDAATLRWFRDSHDMTQTVGPRWLLGSALDVTALGGTTVLLFVVIVTLGFLWIAGKRRAFILVAAASIGGQVLNSSLKGLFSRARPTVVPHLAEVHSSSFPSGHSMMSAVIYLTLGALISSLVQGRLLRAYIITVCILMTICVGASRVFLGVHYPSDVLGGWSVGLAWALFCLLIARYLQHRGQVEVPGEHTRNPLEKKPERQQ